jgi:hypothetical protein
MLFDVAPEELERIAAAGSAELEDALERGRVVHFPSCPVALAGEADLEFLRGLGAKLSRKNVSWYPEDDRLVGLADAAAAAQARAVLRAHSERVRAFLGRAIPRLFRDARVGTSSFRPLQERGRNLSAHASNELIHVDAGAYGATHGDRILRFFVNANAGEDRVWASKGTFRELHQKHAREAGVAGARVQPGPLDRALSAALGAVARVSPKVKMVDTSPYDRAMRRFHNFMKDTPSFRDSSAGLVELRFRPFSAWMVLTDAVSHACLSGQHALVDTFILPLANCRLRDEAPFHILANAS